MPASFPASLVTRRGSIIERDLPSLAHACAWACDKCDALSTTGILFDATGTPVAAIVAEPRAIGGRVALRVGSASVPPVSTTTAPAATLAALDDYACAVAQAARDDRGDAEPARQSRERAVLLALLGIADR